MGGVRSMCGMRCARSSLTDLRHCRRPSLRAPYVDLPFLELFRRFEMAAIGMSLLAAPTRLLSLTPSSSSTTTATRGCTPDSTHNDTARTDDSISSSIPGRHTSRRGAERASGVTVDRDARTI